MLKFSLYFPLHVGKIRFLSSWFCLDHLVKNSNKSAIIHMLRLRKKLALECLGFCTGIWRWSHQVQCFCIYIITCFFKYSAVVYCIVFFPEFMLIFYIKKQQLKTSFWRSLHQWFVSLLLLFFWSLEVILFIQQSWAGCL